MGKVVMSLALVAMVAGTTFLFAAPVLIETDYGVPNTRADLCLKRNIGCGH